MKRIAISTLLAIAPVFVNSARVLHAQDRARPNIVLFVSDDHRHDQLGCAGHPIVQTPVLDGIAKRGVRFSRAFVTTSICAASRATLLTGLYERGHRYTFGRPPIAAHDCRSSYPRVLRDAGYRSGFVGKFGVKMAREERATLFDTFRGMSARPYSKKMEDGSRRHISDRIGDAAIDFVRARDERPFCLSVSFHAVHADDGDKKRHYKYPASEAALYKGVAIAPPPLSAPEIFDAHPEFLKRSMNRDRFFWRWDTREKYERNMRDYYRMMSGMDRVVGRVLQALEDAGVASNTVVIFMGDNGYYMGQRGFAGKWSHYEESLRVPLLIHDPRQPAAARGRVVDSIALNVDIAATILGFAGVEQPERYQGRSLVPHVSAAAPISDWRRDFFCEHLMHRPPQQKSGRGAIPKWEGVRGARYTYARYLEQDPPYEFLHDLERDPQQLVNLAARQDHAAQLERMRTRCAELRDLYGGVYDPRAGPFFANGIKIGEVDTDSARVWMRLTRAPSADFGSLRGEDGGIVKAMPSALSLGRAGEVRLRYGEASGDALRSTAWFAVDAERDFTKQIELTGLRPGTAYRVVAEARGGAGETRSDALRGRFRTAPAASEDAEVRFLVSTCQAVRSVDSERLGHRAYARMLELDPDFFVHTGDIVYFDKLPLCKSAAAARAKWQAMFSYGYSRAFFRNVPSYFMKDDHDTLKNDCWPGQRYGALSFDEGVAIWREQLPVGALPYRSFRWGRHVQIWLTENREYRSPNRMEDGPQKTILGAAQKTWLRESLLASDATHKFVISPGPIVGPDKRGKRDNHSNAAFAHEGKELRRLLSGLERTYVICGDRHWQYCSRDPETSLVELGCGPVNDEHKFGGAPKMDKRMHRYFSRHGGFLQIRVQGDEAFAEWFHVADGAASQKPSKILRLPLKQR